MNIWPIKSYARKKLKKEYEKIGVVIKKTLLFSPSYELINFFKWDILYVNMSVILYWAEKIISNGNGNNGRVRDSKDKKS